MKLKVGFGIAIQTIAVIDRYTLIAVPPIECKFRVVQLTKAFMTQIRYNDGEETKRRKRARAKYGRVAERNKYDTQATRVSMPMNTVALQKRNDENGDYTSQSESQPE